MIADTITRSVNSRHVFECVYGIHLVILIDYFDFSLLQTYVSYVKFSNLSNGISYIAIRQILRELSKNLWHDLIALDSVRNYCRNPDTSKKIAGGDTRQFRNRRGRHEAQKNADGQILAQDFPPPG